LVRLGPLITLGLDAIDLTIDQIFSFEDLSIKSLILVSKFDSLDKPEESWIGSLEQIRTSLDGSPERILDLHVQTFGFPYLGQLLWTLEKLLSYSGFAAL
jgi:hypothetical protein